MSGLGIVQAPCLTFISFEVSRVSSAAKPSFNVRNGRFMPLKCKTFRTIERAKVRAHDLRRGEGQRVCSELTIQKIPYVNDAIKRLSDNHDFLRKKESDPLYLEEAYKRCRLLGAEHEKLLSSVSRIYTEEQQRHLWALQSWARRIDDLVDSPNDDSIRLAYLDQWEERTNDTINGRPHDILDAALADTISKFNIDTTLFEDGLKGMRMDITKMRYANFEELFFYCYYVGATIVLMVFQVLEITPEATLSSKNTYDAAVYFGIALQLTNILNDVSEDAQLGRVYLPQDELAHFGIRDEDIISGKVTDGWKEFMKKQIQRARFYYALAEQGAAEFDKANRSRFLSATMLYGHILDIIEDSDYDNLTKKMVRY